MREQIQEGFEVFLADGEHAFGAVRQVAPHGRPELVVYVENAGDFFVPLDAVEAVHSQKVIVSLRQAGRPPQARHRPRARCGRPKHLKRMPIS